VHLHFHSTVNGALVAHWNGTTWKQLPTPITESALYGVAAPSSTNIWTVGITSQPPPIDNSTLALHHC